MLNKYRWYEYVLIYAGLAVFLTFVLAPFVEAFVVSLRPLSSLFSVPYQFITDKMSFDAYFTMWENVPLLWMYMFNSFFIGHLHEAVKDTLPGFSKWFDWFNFVFVILTAVALMWARTLPLAASSSFLSSFFGR